MRLRRRDERTYWSNEVPVTDAYEALDMLYPDFYDSFGEGTRFIAMGKNPPELHVRWFRDGDSGGASEGVCYYEINRQVVECLEREQWVRMLIVKGWGYATPDPNKLVISERGKSARNAHINEMREAARKLPVAGKHTQFSSVLNDAGHGRETYYGKNRLYFDFETPMRERVRVFPSNKRIKKLPQKAA